MFRVIPCTASARPAPPPDPGMDEAASYGHGRVPERSTRGSVAVRPAGDGPDADPRRHPDLLAGAEVVDVMRPQRAEPADLAAVVADHHVGEDRSGESQGALDSRDDVGV